MSHKAFVLWVIAQAVACGVAIVGLLYIYDPLQLYHKPYFRENAFTDDTRVQNKGIITHYDFTHYILGSCMLQNILASEMEQNLDGAWVNISMAGSSFDTRAVILRYLLEHKQPKHIVYSLDDFSLISPSPSKTDSFDYLYDENPYNDIKIYMNNKFLLCAFSFSSAKICTGVKDLNMLLPWALVDESGVTDLFGGFENWIAHENDRVQSMMESLRSFDHTPFTKLDNTSSTDTRATRIYLQTYLLSFIKEHPNTHFSLIIPPYSRLHWRIHGSDKLAKWQESITYLTQEIAELPNASMYGFDDLNYTTQIANYMDPEHYNIDMNRIFIQALRERTHIIDKANVSSYLWQMEQNIRDYDVVPFTTMLAK